MSATVHDLGVEAQSAISVFYQTVRANSLQLIKPLSAEDCALQAAAFTSPAKWHLAHTTWFFETFILLPHVPSYQVFNPQFQVLFNSYYNGIGEQYLRPKRHLLSRPSLDEVLLYRQHVDQAMSACMDMEFEQLIELGLHHEMQHQELLLMDLKYCFYQNPFFPAYQTTPLKAAHKTEALSWNNFAGGLFEIGHQGNGFHYDNEAPRHQQYIHDFKLANRHITNGEYLEFIQDGGYDNAMVWLSDGWAWRNDNKQHKENNIQKPLYWQFKDGQWFEFTLHGLQALDLNAPVCHINYYEANAFANWAQKTLPTEAQWEHAATSGKHDLDIYSDNHQPLDAGQMFNQVWAWTASSYQPYPGYKAPEGAVGEYNGKFMCNQMVLRGGCALTPQHHVRSSYRNFFYPQDAWVMSGLILADS